MNQLFRLTSTHQSFKDKQKNLFNELEKVSVTLPQQKIYASEDNGSDVDKTSCKSFRGKESIFKKPEVPLKRRLAISKLPDFKRNPHKWTKYTLDDVKDEDISEKSNTRVALAFLKELENRSLATDVDMNVPPDKIMFQKATLINIDSGEQKHTFKSSKVVMPEYVVGQKIKKERRNKSKKLGQLTKQLTLNHLTAEDDESY